MAEKILMELPLLTKDMARWNTMGQHCQVAVLRFKGQKVGPGSDFEMVEVCLPILHDGRPLNELGTPYNRPANVRYRMVIYEERDDG